MKKLPRYILAVGPGEPDMVPNDHGAWVRVDDALEALQARQDMLDGLIGHNRRLLDGIEVADRMRAFLADHPGNEEATLVAQQYDKARAKSMRNKVVRVEVDPADAKLLHRLNHPEGDAP